MTDAANLLSNEIGRRPLVLGIAGGSGSGKSTLAREIADALASRPEPVNCSILGMDRFFRTMDPDAPRIAFSLLPDEQTFDYNHPDATDNSALEAEVKRLAFADSTGDSSVIIVEGLMVLAIEAIRALCDLRVYVKLEDDVRLARRVLRDLDSARRFTQPREIVQYYLESARVGHINYVEPSRRHADLIVRGDSDFRRTARLVCGALCSQ